MAYLEKHCNTNGKRARPESAFYRQTATSDVASDTTNGKPRRIGNAFPYPGSAARTKERAIHSGEGYSNPLATPFPASASRISRSGDLLHLEALGCGLLRLRRLLWNLRRGGYAAHRRNTANPEKLL